MRRPVLVIAVVVAAAVAAAIVIAVARRGPGNPVLATVGSAEIRRGDVDLTIEHFHEEADREARPFPAKDSPRYKQVEEAALRLLIDRAAIEAAAGRLGVHVTAAEVENRLSASPTVESEAGDIRVKAEAAFRRATVRAQLVTEGAFRKLTGGVRVAPATVRAYYRGHASDFASMPFRQAAPVIRRQLLAARKNAVYARWLAGVRRGEPRPKI